MSGSVKLIIAILAAVIGVFIVLKIVGVIMGTLLSLLIPVAVLAGIGFVVYMLVSPRALGGGRRYLP